MKGRFLFEKKYGKYNLVGIVNNNFRKHISWHLDCLKVKIHWKCSPIWSPVTSGDNFLCISGLKTILKFVKKIIGNWPMDMDHTFFQIKTFPFIRILFRYGINGNTSSLIKRDNRSLCDFMASSTTFNVQ